MRAYLDNQVIVGVQEGRHTVSDLQAAIGDDTVTFPFSVAHIYEAEAYKHDDPIERRRFIEARLDAIDAICRSECIWYDQKLRWVVRAQYHPREIMDTINGSIGIAKPAIQIFSSILGESKKDELRSMLGIDARELNNYGPSEVVEQLSKSLVNWGTDLNFPQFIEQAASFHPDGDKFGRCNTFAGIFELLDLMGYWKDKHTPTSNYARLWDAFHAFYASYCDYLVSDDRRMRYKTRVVYGLYGIGTKVVSSKGEED